MSEETNNPEEEVGDDWGAAMAEQAAAESGETESDAAEQPEQATFDNLQSENPVSPSTENLDAILDIPVSLSVEIGQTRISIRNLLQLNQGSVVELDRLAGEPLDIMVNNTLIAHGEVVVVNEKYGIRLTDVISAHERVQNLH